MSNAHTEKAKAKTEKLEKAIKEAEGKATARVKATRNRVKARKSQNKSHLGIESKKENRRSRSVSDFGDKRIWSE